MQAFKPALAAADDEVAAEDVLADDVVDAAAGVLLVLALEPLDLLPVRPV
jgi:hypothetical protein